MSYENCFTCEYFKSDPERCICIDHKNLCPMGEIDEIDIKKKSIMKRVKKLCDVLEIDHLGLTNEGLKRLQDDYNKYVVRGGKIEYKNYKKKEMMSDKYPYYCVEPDCGISDCNECPFSPVVHYKKIKALEKFKGKFRFNKDFCDLDEISDKYKLVIENAELKETVERVNNRIQIFIDNPTEDELLKDQENHDILEAEIKAERKREGG